MYAASPPLYLRLLLTPGSATTLARTSAVAPLATASVALATANASSGSVQHGALSWSSVALAGKGFTYTLALPGVWRAGRMCAWGGGWARVLGGRGTM